LPNLGDAGRAFAVERDDKNVGRLRPAARKVVCGEELMTPARDVVDQQIAAYNERDVDGFAACYAIDAKVVQSDGSLLASGREEIRAVYGGLFGQSPNLRARISNRIEVGDFVIDEEHVTGFVFHNMPSEIHGAVVYRVTDGFIQDAYLYG
jgi:hypothetical protein